MGAVFNLTGTGTGAVKAVNDLNAGLDKTEKTADKAAAATRRLEQAAQRIKESIDPQEKLNRLTKELAGHVTAGRLSIEQATQAHMKYRQEAMGTAKINEKSFGQEFIRNLASVAAGYFSISKAVGLVTDALRQQDQQAQSAAERSARARNGLGSLSQLAAASSNPERAYSRMVAEARSYVGSGAAVDENEAGALLFDLKGAGLNKRDRDFAVKVKAAGTLQNIGGAAQAYDALTTALGKDEVGTFQQFLSKSLRAAGPAPGSFEQLPIAMAQAGGSAKELGVSDEFLAAATTLVGKSKGSISEGGTQVAAFLKQIEKSGDKRFKGVGGVGIVKALAAMSPAQQTFGGVLGDRAEAVEGFRVLRDNLPALVALEADTTRAVDEDLAGRATRLPYSDAQNRAAINAARAGGALDTTIGAQDSERQNLFNTLAKRRAAAVRATGAGAFSRFVDSAMYGASDFIGDEQSALSLSVANQQEITNNGLTPDDVAAIKDYLRRTAQASEGTQRARRGTATTRQE